MKVTVSDLLKYFQVSVYLQNWSHVQSYVNKAEGTPEVTEVRTKQATEKSDSKMNGYTFKGHMSGEI